MTELLGSTLAYPHFDAILQCLSFEYPSFLSSTLNNAIQNGQICIELEGSTLWKGLFVCLPSPLESACERTKESVNRRV